MASGLDAIPGIQCPLPRGAFYCLANISDLLGKSYRGRVIESDDDFAAMLLEEKAVALVPGSGFLAPGHVRLSYALSMEDIQAGMERIREFVKELI